MTTEAPPQAPAETPRFLATTNGNGKAKSALTAMASRLGIEPEKMMETLKRTVFSTCKTNEELAALVVVSNQYNLNPFLKEIYAFPGKTGGIVPIVGIDGWIRIINEAPQMDGIEFEWEHDDKGNLVSCTSIIYRKDRSRPVKVTEYLSECNRNTDPWKMKYRMLRHKALIQGARVAFGFGGIYDEDEAADFANIPPANARTVPAEIPKAPEAPQAPSGDRTPTPRTRKQRQTAPEGTTDAPGASAPTTEPPANPNGAAISREAAIGRITAACSAAGIALPALEHRAFNDMVMVDKSLDAASDSDIANVESKLAELFAKIAELQTA
jgi:phage recombination protein Bet